MSFYGGILMKKIFIIIFSLMLVFSLSGCGSKSASSPDILLEDTDDLLEDFDDYTELPYDDQPDSFMDTKSTSNFNNFSDAQDAFEDHVSQVSNKNETALISSHNLVVSDMKVFDYMLPLYMWGETLDDEELETQDIATSIYEGEDRSYQKYDLERESETRYKVIMETHDGELITTQIDYYPDIDAVRLETIDKGNLALIFEYVKTDKGYAAQYYFNSPIASSYGVQNKAMCVFRQIFSGLNGSLARFEDTEEPPSIIGDNPKEEDFIKGATDWLTVTDGDIKGELNGKSF
jgi:hypothetical protein